MKQSKENGSISPPVLTVGTEQWIAIIFLLRALYPQGMSPSYPLNRILAGPKLSLDIMVKGNISIVHPIASYFADRTISVVF
jgi:hypothetical protein